MRSAGGAISVMMALGLTGPAMADSPLAGNRGGLFSAQIDVLDKRASAQNSRSVSLQPPQAAMPGQLGVGLEYDGGSALDLDLSAGPLGRVMGYGGAYRGPFVDMARSAARRHDIPEDLFLRLVQQESGWRQGAISHAGAMGLAQLMPGTARDLGVTDAWDPHQNLDGGARYLRQQFREFQSWQLALAAYNAGPEAVRRHGGVPPYSETRNYVRTIWGS